MLFLVVKRYQIFTEKNESFVSQVPNQTVSTYEYLIGKSIEKFGSSSPREIDILRLYASFSASSESEKISKILKEIKEHYGQRRIRTKNNETIRIKIKRLVSSYKSLLAKRKGKSAKERRRQEVYVEHIHRCFNVASNVDPDPDPDPDGSSDRDDPDPNDDPTDPEYIPSDSEPSDDDSETLPKCSVPEFLLKEVAQSKASYRVSEKLLKVGVKINDGNPHRYPLSKTSIWSKVARIRRETSAKHLEKLTSYRGQIVVQFDGKACHKLNARHLGREERLIIVCHTEQCDIPLGFFILDSHTGHDCATKVANSIRINDLENNIIGVGCDTENVNTGIHNGAVHLLENMLEKELLHLMCRHHIFEVMLKDVFISLFGGTTGSRVTTFQFLNDNWETIKQTGFAYVPVSEEELMPPILQRLSEDAKHSLSRHHTYFRNDYSELIDLSLKFLGVNTRKNFHVPGATNNARWMFRAIYSLKSFLFRDQLELDDDFVHLLQRFCMFVALIYVKFWNRCSHSIDAAFNDIQLLNEIDAYKQVDPQISDVASTAMKRHLWYLSDELIVLSLFSSKVSAAAKNAICARLDHNNVGERTRNSRRHTDEIRSIPNLELQSFVSERSFFLLDVLAIDTSFLLENANDWEHMESYRLAAEKIGKMITCVNDSAERGLQLGAKAIDEQRVQSEERLQDFVISSYDG